MYSNPPAPLYSTRHYIHEPQSNSRNSYDRSYDQSNPSNNYSPSYNQSNPSSNYTRSYDQSNNYGRSYDQSYPTNNYGRSYDQQNSSNNYGRSNEPSNSRNSYGSSHDPSYSTAQQYPYYRNNQPPTTVTYINDRSNNGQQSTAYVPPSPTRNQSPPNYSRGSGIRPPAGGGQIEKTNTMSTENPFYNTGRQHSQNNTSRVTDSITSAAKTGGSVNKTLNLSEENPFYTVYGGYQYPTQIDPSKRITTQNVPQRSMDNKSLNLSDENPFYSTYGRYHYPSQIDPQKRITELPKSSGPLLPTNDLSEDNPFQNYRPPTYRNPSSTNTHAGSTADWNRNNNPAPLSYRPIDVQRPQPPTQSNYNQPQPSFDRPATPPTPPQPVQTRAPPPPPPSRPNPSAPLDKTSLNMSPDNPFAQTYGRYHYPSPEEVKIQKRTQERSNRFTEQQSVRDTANNNISNNNNNNNPVPVKDTQNNRPVKPTNQMTEYPETENKDITKGKGNSKYARFDVNF